MPSAEATYAGGQAADSSRETILSSPPQPTALLGGSVLGAGAGLFGGNVGYLQQTVPHGVAKSDESVGSTLSLAPAVSLSLTPAQPLGYGLLGSAAAPSWNPLFNPLGAQHPQLAAPHPSLAFNSARPTPPPAVQSMNRAFGGAMMPQQSQPLAPMQQPATSPPLQSLPSNLNTQLSLLSQVNKQNSLQQLGQQQRGSLSGNCFT